MSEPAPATRKPAEAQAGAGQPAGKRDAILAAALSLFNERSFAATPVPLIAERAGVAAGTIYRYFPSKEALANEVYRYWKARIAEALVDGMDLEAPPREVFGHLWRAMWRFAEAHPDALAFVETHHHASYLDDESRALSAMLARNAELIARRAQADGTIGDEDPALLLALVSGAFVGIRKALEEGQLALDDEACERTEAIVWKMLAPPALP